jgi:hypothetical protein
MGSPKSKLNVEPKNFSAAEPEFGRTSDVERLFGLKRGTLYNLYNAGKIKGACIQVLGKKSGVRVWDIESIRNFIHALLGTAVNGPASKSPSNEPSQAGPFDPKTKPEKKCKTEEPAQSWPVPNGA